MIAGHDPAGVAATTRFLASGAQPFTTAAELAAIAAPALVVLGADATHPAEVADRHARYLRRCTVREADAAGYAAAIAGFLDQQVVV